MRSFIFGALITGVSMLAVPALAADVTVTMSNGTVSVSARDATVGQILAEWSRVGQTRIVNAERVAGAPLTLELTNVPEAQALDTILRSVSGYVAAPRATAEPRASVYDRIFLLPTSTGTAQRQVAAAPAPSGGFQAPPFPQPQDDGDRDVELPRGPFPGAGAGAAGQPPVRVNGPTPFGQPPIPQQAPSQALPPVNATTPSGPFGVSTPGMPVPTPQQQGLPIRVDNP